ncbi:YDG domain-containing protein [Raphanus sativus]|uniref:YDG domain-containing protein At5g47150-like n=1 Tax=Raphanus sativus TaxID=3726 RepID=A0A6J0JL78_RAPSA|nr:YDG domain-containing protein At5g47150-like [Raphanus sativus]KAJ4888591.1 YDG domain-containing protein [Raphanus sativus]
MNPSQKQPVVRASTDFPPDCGSSSSVPDEAFKKSITGDVVVENPSVGHAVADSEHVGVSLREGQEFRNSHQDDHVPTPGEKVHEVLRVFKEVFRQLDRDKQARRGGDLYEATARIDLKTQVFLEKEGKNVNTPNRIGQVPKIQIGDEFQYKAELRLVGLHFRTMSGIDYVEIGGVKLATSIVSSDRYDFNDKFAADGMVYTGEGGNMISKGKKAEDQRMIKGNLALANSMRHKTEVRVIRGGERWDGKGKHYVYDGLYLVDKYWLEKGASGKSVYKFKLCRIPGQAPVI